MSYLLVGSNIQKIIYSGTLRLVFGDFEEDYLDLIGRFEVKRYGKKFALAPKSKEALLLSYDLLDAKTLVREAKAAKEGLLFLLFDDDTEIAIGTPDEYWQFTRHSSRHPSSNVSISGGLGYLDF